MRLSHYLLLPFFLLTFTLGANMLLGCSETKKEVLKIETDVSETTIDLRATILGVWLPHDSIRGGVYLNHHRPSILLDREGTIYYTTSLASDSEIHKCIAEEYNVQDSTVWLYFVYGTTRTVADYCYQIKVIDANTLVWYNYGMSSEGEKSYREHNSFRSVRKGGERNYLSYNNILPTEVQNRTWIELDHYRGDYYYAAYGEEYTPFLKTYTDSLATRDAYNRALWTEAVKHCRTEKDTLFIGGDSPQYRFIWLDKKKGVALFCHPWEDMDATSKRLLIDSTKYTKELLPSKKQLLERDVERVAFYKKWKEKGYTEEQIDGFRWYRTSPDIAFDMFEKEEDSMYDHRSGEMLEALTSDYDGDGLVDYIYLEEDWLYEKDINHDYLDYTIEILKNLDESVYVSKGRLKVQRPMLEDFMISTPGNGLLELKYDVYAQRGYDTWEYREKTLAEVDRVNSYTYTYQYNGATEDWDLTKINVVIKKPGSTTQKSVSPQGRTLYTLKKDMDPMDDAE